MNRIYHTFDKWECYPAGFYENRPANEMKEDKCHETYRDLLADIPKFEAALGRVITEWVFSCEQYLSNERMNRIAWLGQASLCIAYGIPSCFRGGFNRLSKPQQEAANNSALNYLNKWLQARGEPPVTLEQAGINAKADLY